MDDTTVMAPTIVLGDAEAAWARRLLGSMPFGASAHFRSLHKTDQLTVRDVLDDIDRLREVLEEHGPSCEERDKELAIFRSDVAALHRLVSGRP